ncbi:MAG TPA: hypothetical protein PLK30_27060 [Blastocatellia bacterium]|nr:hypothetical protein [Blastocatellia bacterium]
MIVLALAGSVLSIDGSFLVVFISILLLIFILNRTLFKPINQVLDERNHLGAGRMAEAKQLLAQYEQRLNGYEQQIQSARAEAYQFMETQRRDAQAARAEMIAQVKSETAAQIAAAREDISKQTVAAKANLEGEARAMAGVISSQILHRPISGGGN